MCNFPPLFKEESPTKNRCISKKTLKVPTPLDRIRVTAIDLCVSYLGFYPNYSRHSLTKCIWSHMAGDSYSWKKAEIKKCFQVTTCAWTHGRRTRLLAYMQIAGGGAFHQHGDGKWANLKEHQAEAKEDLKLEQGFPIQLQNIPKHAAWATKERLEWLRTGQNVKRCNF